MGDITNTPYRHNSQALSYTMMFKWGAINRTPLKHHRGMGRFWVWVNGRARLLYGSKYGDVVTIHGGSRLRRKTRSWHAQLTRARVGGDRRHIWHHCSRWLHPDMLSWRTSRSRSHGKWSHTWHPRHASRDLWGHPRRGHPRRQGCARRRKRRHLQRHPRRQRCHSRACARRCHSRGCARPCPSARRCPSRGCAKRRHSWPCARR